MAKLRFTTSEVDKFKITIIDGHTSWSNPRLNDLKRKIKDHHLERQNHCCCYCNRNVFGEFRMVLDIEHIIPKSELLDHIFTQRNLSVACKRCNMKIKKADLSFLISPLRHLPNRLFRSRYYKFIHPNLDNYNAHLLYCSIQRGRKKLIKYDIVDGSPKGQFNYDYFKLEQLELNSYDIAQGATERVEINDSDIDAQFNQLVSNLI
jgi:hypothetical protein